MLGLYRYHVKSLLWPLLSCTEQMWASIQNSTISIRAYDKERRDVSDYDFFFSAGFHGIKGAVKHQSVTKKMDIIGFHSAEGHCYLQYSQPYSTASKITKWIDNLCTTVFLYTYDVDEQISTEDNQYGSNTRPGSLTTTPRRQCGSIR